MLTYADVCWMQAMAVKEQLLITASSLHNKQMKALEEQMHDCQRARQQACRRMLTYADEC
jgi:hypothetical protein